MQYIKQRIHKLFIFDWGLNLRLDVAKALQVDKIVLFQLLKRSVLISCCQTMQ